ncbi:hypothetical protein AgCh_016774 [Apium graveolens]
MSKILSEFESSSEFDDSVPDFAMYNLLDNDNTSSVNPKHDISNISNKVLEKNGAIYVMCDMIMFELGYKLGELNKRGKSVYYARFFMMLANHLIENIVVENPTNKLNCWVQERRIIADLNRASHHKEMPLFYFPSMEGPQVSEVSTTVSTLPISQTSLPSSVAMESVSMTQQMPTQATKTTISKSKAKKAPSGFSQKKPVVKSIKHKEGSVKEGELVLSSQKNVTIETSSQPGAQAKRGTHTVQTGAKDSVTAPSQNQLDVTPINVESQPKSLIIEAPKTSNSPPLSLDVDMIHTSLPNSTSLTLLEKPKIQASEHHLLDDLLAHLPILSESIETFMPKFSSICTESTIVSTPNSFISSIPVDIIHPSSSDYIPTDVPNSSHPSASLTTIQMDIPHPSVLSAELQIPTIVTSADDLVVVQPLLGLRAESELSERLGCSPTKGEEMSEPILAISSGLAKVSEGSPTLDGEAYQTLAGQGNEEAEKMFNLVHTNASLQRANDAITAIPSTTNSDFELADDSFGDAGGDDKEDSMSIGGDADISSWIKKRLLTTYLEALQLHKIQALQHSQSVDEIKQEVSEVKQDFIARLDARLSGTTMTEISHKLRKEADLNRKFELMAARLPSTQQLDANKKGEKAIAFTKPPALDSIDLINLATAKLESNDKLTKIDVVAAEKELDKKWKKIDVDIHKKFGQTSYIKSPKADLILKPKRKYSKFSDKNHVDLLFETPRPDKKKLLTRSITFSKDSSDSVQKKRIANIYRNGREICVVAGHPLFVEAKKEEKQRIKQEKK